MNLKTFDALKKSLDGLRLAEFMEIRANIEEKLKKYPKKSIFTILDGLEKEYENPR